MKIKKIKFNNHAVFKNLEVDFTGENEEALPLIVLAGENGCGKTKLFEGIIRYFTKLIEHQVTDEIEFQFEDFEEELINGLDFFKSNNPKGKLREFFNRLNTLTHSNGKEYEFDKGKVIKVMSEMGNLPKIIYMPAEINFTEITNINDKYKYEYKFINKIDMNLVKDIPSYLATKIKILQKENEEMTFKEIKEKISNEVNEIFEILGLDIKMIGFTLGEKDLPLFTNSYKETFDLNKLSSGEKQLFIRALSLKMVSANNSIILIDEPEISLHPKWQQRILKVYENIGENNQIIIATHSPHILGGVQNSSIRIMKKGEKSIEIIKNEDKFYGGSMETILEDLMGLDDSIDPEVSEELKKLNLMIENLDIESEEFNSKLKDMKSKLGPFNEKLMLLNIALNRAMHLLEKNK